jgi:hypothetical protein
MGEGGGGEGGGGGGEGGGGGGNGALPGGYGAGEGKDGGCGGRQAETEPYPPTTPSRVVAQRQTMLRVSGNHDGRPEAFVVAQIPKLGPWGVGVRSRRST